MLQNFPKLVVHLKPDSKRKAKHIMYKLEEKKKANLVKNQREKNYTPNFYIIQHSDYWVCIQDLNSLHQSDTFSTIVFIALFKTVTI